MNNPMTPEAAERYAFRPSMFFEGRYQVVDAKGTPIGSARDISDAETVTRYLNKAGREEVEPLELKVQEQADEVAKLRALVHVLVNAWWTADGGHDMHKAIATAKEAGFTPTTNTEDNG